MRLSVARNLLGVSPDASLSQLKSAYRQKALEKHPDRLPPNLKKCAESEFRQITEAYTCLKSVVQLQHKTIKGKNGGVAEGIAKGGRRVHYASSALPFLLIIFGTIGLGGLRATRAYRESCEQSASRNPFLP